MSDPVIRVFIADDHPIFREGLKKVISRDPQIEVVGEADDGTAAIAAINELRPDVAVLDMNMPGTDGLGVLDAVRDAGVPTKVIFLTMHDSEAIFRQALDQGAAGYVLKDGAVAEIVSGIRTVHSGRNYISPELSTHLVNRNRSVRIEQKPTLADLTPAERRVLKLIAEDKTSREIAAELFISIRTVEHHRSHICEKLNLSGFNSLVKFAVTHKEEIS